MVEPLTSLRRAVDIREISRAPWGRVLAALSAQSSRMPDLQSQFEELLGEVWRQEAFERTHPLHVRSDTRRTRPLTEAHGQLTRYLRGLTRDTYLLSFTSSHDRPKWPSASYWKEGVDPSTSLAMRIR